jgi:hypothetical protein
MNIDNERRNVLKMSIGTAAIAATQSLFVTSSLSACSNTDKKTVYYTSIRQQLDQQVISGGVQGLICAGIMSANPHNTQPWQFTFDNNCIYIYADLSRQLTAIDCYYREMLLGIGCAIENICAAATALDIGHHVTLFTQGVGNTEVARIILNDLPDDKHLPSNHAIINRHTNRGPYQPEQPLSANFTQAVMKNSNGQISLLDAQSSEGKLFAKATIDATAKIIQNREMVKNDQHWWRDSEKEMLLHRDGVSALSAGLPAWKRWFALQFPADADDAGKYWLQQTEEVQLPSTRNFMIIAVPDRTNRTQMVEAGRQLQRVNLLAAHHQVAIQPLNQVFEIADWEQEQRNGAGWKQLSALYHFPSPHNLQPVFAARLGISSYQGPKSIRRPLHEVLNNSAIKPMLWSEPVIKLRTNGEVGDLSEVSQ